MHYYIQSKKTSSMVIFPFFTKIIKFTKDKIQIIRKD
ncbi:hypothetical protein BS78_06G236900 [Paspalum vaginatum]|nr:hypothetical protein BS78_06G236900 [Paspalum vaginatum]